MYSVVLLVIVAGGAFGGVVNLALTADPLPKRLKWNVIAGIGAAALVPLFLQTASSQLFTSLFTSPPPPTRAGDLMLFASFCVLAGITAQRFIETVSDGVLKEQVRKNTEGLQENRQRIDQASEGVDAAKATARAAIDAVEFGTIDKRETSSVPLTASAADADIAPGSEPDDPWKGVFGGSPSANGRVLEATLTPLSPDWELVTIALLVKSTDPKKPLAGAVQFFLHPTIGNAKPVVAVRDGEARLSLVTYGAFTVGALVDGGATRLELDLASHPSARSPWKDL
jgi:hypothetical protein